MYEEPASQTSSVSDASHEKCPFKPGMERHVVPLGDAQRVITKASSDEIFGPDGLGFSSGVWQRLVSWLARNGIQEQTGSKSDETNIEGCVKGWGQGAYSSRVFSVKTGVDVEQMERLIAHLEYIAAELKVANGRFTDRVLAAFVESQTPQLYSTWTGLRSADSRGSRLKSRFRAHIQWQAFVELCGLVDTQGVKHVTPNLIREFFQSEQPFFEGVVQRRRDLRTRKLTAGDRVGLLAKMEPWVDSIATDLEFRREKSGALLVAKIAKYMVAREGSKLLPLSTKLPGSPTHQYAMTVMVPVAPENVPALRVLLAQINKEIIAQMRGIAPVACSLPLHEVDGLHYGRFVLIEASAKHGDPATLVFATDFDGPSGDVRRDAAAARRAHIAELARKAYVGLDQVYAHCIGYKKSSGSAALISFLSAAAHQIPAQTFYTGSAGRSLAQILAESELRQSLEQAADAVSRQVPRITDPEEVRQAILAELEQRGVDIPPPFPAQPNGEPLIRRVGILLGAALLLTLPISLPGALLLYLVLRWKERTDVPEAVEHSEAAVRHIIEVSAAENEMRQNQLTHLVELKEGWFRLLVIKVVFTALQFLAIHRYNKGRLGNIPSIHFARWVFLGKERRVLFFSNFDNSWQTYLGDFVDQASNGLTGVWSNTKGYPRTKNLLNAGARNATSFLAWTRAHQLPTDVWYSAYPALSIRSVNANTLLRRGLTDFEGVAARDWLRVLGGEDLTPLAQPDAPGSKPKPVVLPVDDIQGIILKGYGFLQHAAFLMLKVEKPAEARRWLSQLPITPASRGSRDHHTDEGLRHQLTFVNVAFTHRGLEELGADSTLLGGFPAEFVMGSHAPYRSRVLGDVGTSAPEHWKWGNEQNPVHVLLMLYCHSSKQLDVARTQYLSDASANGLSVVMENLEGNHLPGRKEHFGFRDGIAQPGIRNNPFEEGNEATDVAPGEFLLGFPNGYHTEDDTGEANIAFAPKTADGFEFCKGGSYLVFRQLEQNVPAFWKYCHAASSHLGLQPIALASKMVGRWPNGEPLLHSPDRMREPAHASDEDAFGYVSGDISDSNGARCPFGAHVRRSNPRDWLLGSNTSESAQLSMLHRIIRRGRPYGPEIPGKRESEHEIDELVAHALEAEHAERGLQFLCFNANIERQFEFIQQQWLNNSQFGGLHSDADPVIGGQNRTGEGFGAGVSAFTVQSDPIRQRCTGLNEFVRVKGSSYFLMPPISAVRHLAKMGSAR